MCQTRLQLQSYKKYFKYTMMLCKIHNINKHAIKKARRLLFSLCANLFLWLTLNQAQSYKKFSFRVRHLSATHEIFAIQCNKQTPCHEYFIASLIASYCITLHHFNLDGGTKNEQ